MSMKCIWITGKTGRRKQNFNSKDDEVWTDILEKKGSGLYLFTELKFITTDIRMNIMERFQSMRMNPLREPTPLGSDK